MSETKEQRLVRCLKELRQLMEGGLDYEQIDVDTNVPHYLLDIVQDALRDCGEMP